MIMPREALIDEARMQVSDHQGHAQIAGREQASGVTIHLFDKRLSQMVPYSDSVTIRCELCVAADAAGQQNFVGCWRRFKIEPPGVRIKTWTGFMPQVQGSPGIG